jgi:hypothetical protein
MRFSGTVGYATTNEEAPGVWQDTMTERTYFGDVVRNARRLESPLLVPPMLNANVALENSFSIVADAYAYDNYTKIRYVEWKGLRWTVTNVEVQRPRLTLTIGEPWNGNTA